MRSLMIERSSRDELMDVSTYRRTLRLSWESYNPGLYNYVLTYEPDIEDAKVKGEILNIRGKRLRYVDLVG